MEDITYNELIQNILDTRGRFGCGDKYHERHHIVPKCVGGTNDENNLIDLYAQEHFEAHRLLALENPENDKLIFAWSMMSFTKGKNQDRYEIIPKEYEEIKTALSQLASEKYKWENNPFYGHHHSEETKERMKESSRKRWNRPEEKEKIRKARENDTPETHKKRSISQKKRFEKSENHPWSGRHHTDESREKMKKAKDGMYMGADNPRAKKVIRLLDNKIYNCIIDAAIENNIGRDTMRNRCKKYKGFMFYDDYLLQLNIPT